MVASSNANNLEPVQSKPIPAETISPHQEGKRVEDNRYRPKFKPTHKRREQPNVSTHPLYYVN